MATGDDDDVARAPVDSDAACTAADRSSSRVIRAESHGKPSLFSVALDGFTTIRAGLRPREPTRLTRRDDGRELDGVTECESFGDVLLVTPVKPVPLLDSMCGGTYGFRSCLNDSIPANLLFSSSDTENVLPTSNAGDFTVISRPPKRKCDFPLKIRTENTSRADDSSKDAGSASFSSSITRSSETQSPSFLSV